MTVMEFGMYPKSIFSKSFQSILTYVIPVSLLASHPASALLGSVDGTVLPALFSSVIFLLLGIAFYFKMVKNYTSAGG